MKKLLVILALGLCSSLLLAQGGITGGPASVSVSLPSPLLYGMPITVPVNVNLSTVSGNTTVGLGGFVIPVGYNSSVFNYTQAQNGDLPGDSTTNPPTLTFVSTDPSIADSNGWFAMVGATSSDSVGPTYNVADFSGRIIGIGNTNFIINQGGLPTQNQLSLSSKWTASDGGPESIPASGATISGTSVTGRFVVATGDYDADGVSDVGVFRPSSSQWIIQGSTAGTMMRTHGNSDDFVSPGDYNGDGRTDWAVFRPSDGRWYITYNGVTGSAVYSWGMSGDIPVPGDYNDDGITDPAVFRPSDGKWYIRLSGGGTLTFSWGLPGDVPVPGDYNGDGFVDPAVFRPSDNRWYIRYNGLTGAGSFRVYSWGNPGDIPVNGDFNGDGIMDPTVYRPSDNRWYVRFTSGPLVFAMYSWGVSGDIPVPGKYSGAVSTDIAVYRPSEGRWYIRPISGSTFVKGWGVPGDLPLGR